VGPRFDELRAGGIAVHALPIRHLFDLNGTRRLRQVLNELQPTVIHAWGSFATRITRFVLPGPGVANRSPRLVVSGVATPDAGWRGWLAIRQLRRADRVVPALRIEGERYRRFGVSSDRLTLIGPSSPAVSHKVDRAELCQSLGIPLTSQLLLSGGQSERGIGPKDAIVAFDMLRYESPNLHLIVFGAGKEAGALESFGRALAFDDYRIRFAKCVPERASAVQFACAVLITQTSGGVEEALEAMAAAKPIVGWQTPELAEIVEDGVSGFLVPLGDRATLAARTRKLLDEPELATRMGEAGRTRVNERFTIHRMVEQYARLYEYLAQ
jgi:glycosyltransferase involved in cell wall biosynthesis